MIVVRMLLNSWATLDASVPTLLSRWAWRSWRRRISVSSGGAARTWGPVMGSSPVGGSAIERDEAEDGIGRAERASSSELPAAGSGRSGSSLGGVGFLMDAPDLVGDVADPVGPPGPAGPGQLGDGAVRDPPEAGPIGDIIPRQHVQQDHPDDDPVRDDDHQFPR